MKKLKIIVDNDLFIYEISINVATIFYIEDNGYCFPDDKWNDFTNIILGEWTYKILQLYYCDNIKFKFYFIDGPFRLDIFKDNNMKLTIDCINYRGYREKCEHTITISYYDFIDALYDAYKAFSYILYSNGLHKGKYESVYNQSIKETKELKNIRNRQFSICEMV